eukprot:477761-Pelagomonas_calceolata.AAC.2
MPNNHKRKRQEHEHKQSSAQQEDDAEEDERHTQRFFHSMPTHAFGQGIQAIVTDCRRSHLAAVTAFTQVNFLGPYTLTRCLAPSLTAAAAEDGDARIVNVASVMHRAIKLLGSPDQAHHVQLLRSSIQKDKNHVQADGEASACGKLGAVHLLAFCAQFLSASMPCQKSGHVFIHGISKEGPARIIAVCLHHAGGLPYPMIPRNSSQIGLGMTVVAPIAIASMLGWCSC